MEGSEIPKSAEDIFLDALERPYPERAGFVEKACRGDASLKAEVDSLLESDAKAASKGFLETPPLVPPSPRLAGDEGFQDALLGRRIGQFMITRLIASGGMGTVYEALQDSPRRRVALKVVHTHLSSRSVLRRFAYEAEILARLHHPGVAQVFEAGSFGTERPVPYIAMEYVPGARTVTRYAMEEALSLRERISLFIEVCDAVYHGHQRGVIHRDLKPGNVLVDEGGRPKVIDFGIARAVGTDWTQTLEQTRSTRIAGTVRYMSPEQWTGNVTDLDVRCDVYALGMVLFELLTGNQPYDFAQVSPFEVPRLIREKEPKHPSFFDRTLRGDLDVIALKALEKDRDRRYSSVVKLSVDLRKYLAGEPIEARRGHRGYWMRKTIWRYRIAFAAGTSLVLFLLGFGVVMSRLYTRAERDAQTARQVQGLLEEILNASDPFSAPGQEPSLRSLLDDAARRMETQHVSDPRVRASGLHTLGAVYLNLGRFEEAEKHLRAALALRERWLGDAHRETLETRLRFAQLENIKGDYAAAENQLREVIQKAPGVNDQGDRLLEVAPGVLALVLKNRGKYAEAENFAREYLNAARTRYPALHPRTALALNILASILQKEARFHEAEQCLREASGIQRELLGDEHPELARTLNNLALALMEEGDFAAAESCQREALGMQRRLLEEGHPDLATSLDNLGSILVRRGNAAAAKPLIEEALASRRAHLGKDHPQVASGLFNLGHCFDALGDYGSAERVLREALAINRAAAGADPCNTAETMTLLGTALKKTGKTAEAEELLREALVVQKKCLGPAHVKVFNTANDLALLLKDQGQAAAAAPLLRDALERSTESLGAEHPNTLTYQTNLGAVLCDLSEFDEAGSMLQASLDSSRRLFGKSNPRVANVLQELGRLYIVQDRFVEAQPLFLEAYDIRCRALSESHPNTLASLYWYASSLAGAKDYAGAVSWLRRYVDCMEKAYPNSVYLFINRSLLGECLAELSRFEEAEPLLRGGMEALRKGLGDSHPLTQAALGRMVRFCEASGRSQEASSLRALIKQDS